MRKTTRSKYYGRTEVAGALSTMAIELARCSNSCVYHKLGGKRLQAKLKREYEHIQELRREVIDIPVTPDEKVLAKRKKKIEGVEKCQ